MRAFFVVASCLYLTIAGASEDAQEESPGAGLFLADIEVHSGVLPGAVSATDALTLDLHSSDVSRLRTQLEGVNNVEVLNWDENKATLRVRVNPGARFTRPPSGRDQLASWVIDFDQPAVAAVSTLWRERRDMERVDQVPARLEDASAAPNTEISALIGFTADQIETPTYRHGLLIASQVAKRREGDCTEYGVLQTALARGEGYASRLALGVVLVAVGNEIRAYGHAWSEIHTGERWLLADATQLELDKGVQGVWHLPVMLFENEGPGHLFELVKFSALRPDSLTLIHSVQEIIEDQ